MLLLTSITTYYPLRAFRYLGTFPYSNPQSTVLILYSSFTFKMPTLFPTPFECFNLLDHSLVISNSTRSRCLRSRWRILTDQPFSYLDSREVLSMSLYSHLGLAVVRSLHFPSG